jgi:hypothetical protein
MSLYLTYQHGVCGASGEVIDSFHSNHTFPIEDVKIKTKDDLSYLYTSDSSGSLRVSVRQNTDYSHIVNVCDGRMPTC